MKEVGKRIRETRIIKGISQNELAKKLGIHQTAVSKYESGERSPNIEMLIQIVKILDTSADYILGIRDYE